MKKGIFTLLTALTVLALAVTGCPTDGGGGDKTYTVTFDKGGGTGTAPVAKTVNAGSSINLPGKGGMLGPTTPTAKPNFLGWASATGATTADIGGVGDEYTPTGDVTVYAVWSATAAIEYTITFSLNGGGGTAPDPVTWTTGSTAITLPGVGEMTGPSGKTYFLGWAKTSSAAAPDVGPSSYTPSGTTAAITLYAVWSATAATPATVTFNSNTGTGTVPSITTVVNATIQLPLSTGLTGPTGKPSFKGWATDAAGTTLLQPGADYVVSSATVTLYAVWGTSGDTPTPDTPVTVTFVLNWPIDGEPSTAITRQTGTDGKLSAADIFTPTTAQTPSEVEYEFVEWNTAANGTGTAVTTATTFSEDTTIYGKWVLIVEVIYETKGGSAVAHGKVKNGSAITAAPTAPTKTGTDGTWRFLGWYKEATYRTKVDFGTGGTVISVGVGVYEVTLYAEWEWTPAAKFGAVERATLANASQVVYYFDTDGKTWDNFAKVSVSYMLETDEEFEVSNSARALRLYGNYDLDFFQFNTTTAGNKYAYASLDGAANNNEYILENGKGGWISLKDALVGYTNSSNVAVPGIFPDDYVPEGKKWFTLDYTIDGSNANVKPHKHLPDPTATGPFIFGFGLPGADDRNTFYIKDVTLVGKLPADNVTGKALYIKKQVTGVDTAEYSYPAFSAYGTADRNGVDQISRLIFGDNKIELPAADRTKYTITFDLNAGTLSAAFTDTAFGGTKEVEKYGALDSFPVATAKSSTGLAAPDKKVAGWGLTNTDTAAQKIALNYAFTGDTTVYAIWGPNLPDATADKVITPNIASFGGLGAHEADAGYGPFDFLNSMSSQATLWFSIADELTTVVYQSVTIKYTAVKKANDSSSLPRKMIFRNGRADNVWSGGIDIYQDINVDTEQTQTITINDLTISAGIQIQHNKNAAESCNFAVTITEIKLIKP